MALFPRSSKQVGNDAESLACDYLQRQGMSLLTRNFHCKCGELDLVMQDKNSIVFVEVRYRSNPHYGSPADSVTSAKQDKLIKTALYYLQQHPGLARRASRFDVIAISSRNAETKIEWIKNAFLAG